MGKVHKNKKKKHDNHAEKHIEEPHIDLSRESMFQALSQDFKERQARSPFRNVNRPYQNTLPSNPWKYGLDDF